MKFLSKYLGLRDFWGCFAIIAIALCGCGGRSAQSPQLQLISAVLAGDVAKVESLLNDPSVNINWKGPKTGNSALNTAAGYNKGVIVQLLLRRGADPNIATDENETPLLSAAYHGYTDIVKMLIDAGADVNKAETRYGYTPLASAAYKGHAEVVKLLLNAGANRDARVKDGRTAEQLAQRFGHPDAVQALISYQPDAAKRTEHSAGDKEKLQ